MGKTECKNLYQNANELQEKHQFTEALAVYKQIIEEYPESPEAKYSQKCIARIEKSKAEDNEETPDESEIESEMEMEESLTEILRNREECKPKSENKGLVIILYALSGLSLLGGIIRGTAFIAAARIVAGITSILTGVGMAILIWALGDIVKNLRIIVRKVR